MQSKPLEASPQRSVSSLRILASTAVLPLLLLTGLFLRLWNLGLIRHNYDWGVSINQAIQIVEAQQFPLTGPHSSVFLNHPAFMSYLEVLPLMVWRSPWSVYIFVAALNALAIPFVYRITNQFLGQSCAIVASLLFATNPWVIYYSRVPWPPGLIPFYMAVIAWGLWPVASRHLPHSRTWVAGLAFVATAQSHLQSFGVASFQVLPLLFLFRKRILWRPIVLIFFILVLASGIYVIGIATLWESQSFKWNLFFAEGERRIQADPLFHAVRLVTGWDYDYVYSREMPDYATRRLWSLVVHAFLTVALCAGLIRAGTALVRRTTQANIAAILLIWFGAPVVLMSFSSHDVPPFYLLVSVPAGHILAAWGLSLALDYKTLRPFAFAALAATTLLFALNFHRANQQVALNPTPATWEGWALRAGVAVGNSIRELFADNPPPRYVVSVEEPAPPGTGSLILSSLSSLSLQVEERQMEPALETFALLYEDEPLLYVFPHRTVSEETGTHFASKELLLENGTPVSFVRLPSYNELAAGEPNSILLNWPSEAGLSLLRYASPPVSSPGQELDLTTYWRVDRLPADPAQTFVGAFYHLLDQQGNQVANVSGSGRWGYQWKTGDIYREQVRIPMPPNLAPGQYTLLIGLFDTLHNRNYSLVSPDGLLYALTVPVTID